LFCFFKYVKITLVFGEPHFVTTLLPWHNIYFWYLKNEVSKFLATSAATVPVGATVWAVAVQFSDLWKIRAPLHSVEGFKMSDFDKLIEVQQNDYRRMYQFFIHIEMALASWKLYKVHQHINPFSATARYIGFCSSGEKCRKPIYRLGALLLQNIIQTFCVVIITFILNVICENFITNN
jgi:hypothetical protein